MSSAFGSPPPGIDLNASTKARNNAAVITVITIATVALILRLCARRVQYIALVADDYFVIVALVFVYASAGLSIASGYYGAGKHVWAATSSEILMIAKILYAYTFIYAASVSFTKLSIICFYHRVFGNTSRAFNWCLYGCFTVTICYIIMIWTTMLGSCRPIHYFWDQYVDPTAKGSCIKVNEFFLIAGALNMVLDVVILLIPIPKIMKLQMSQRRKLTVIGIMMLGSFVCVSSIVRIYYLVKLQNAVDLTWMMGFVFIWSSVEPSIGILSACLPVLRPLLRVVFRSYFTSNKHSASHELETSSRWNKFHRTKSVNGTNFSEHHTFTGKLRPEDDEVRLTNDVTVGSFEHRLDNEARDQGVPDKSIMVETYVTQTTTSASD